jgi:coproporphyrinogen III oxidase
MCIRDNLGEPLLYPTFKPRTHKPYILIHCTNIVNVNGLLYIWQNPSAFNSDYVVAVFTEKITDQYQQICDKRVSRQSYNAVTFVTMEQKRSCS